MADESKGAVAVRFGLDEANAAADAWGFNCGPGALCAVLGFTPDELRPHMGEFEAKGYTNPTLMFDVLRRLGVRYRQTYRTDAPGDCELKFGLMRVQWAGPWTKPGVPMAARYRQTHWIAVAEDRVFDINAICVGGWLSRAEWKNKLVPWLLREAVPKATGEWWPTHGLEVLTGARNG
jgi:hypothetical protein